MPTAARRERRPPHDPAPRFGRCRTSRHGRSPPSTGQRGSERSADTTVAVDETDAPDPRPTEPDPTVAPTTSTPALTLPTASPTTLSTTLSTSTVDLGNGVSFTFPDGYTSAPAGNGIEITALAQEYIDGFDANFAAATYSQAIPAGPDADGVSDSDGYFIYYRVLDADGSGFSGLIDASRRADGLVYVTDTYRPIDDTSGDRVPADVYDEFYGSYLAAPIVGTEVPLTPLTLARVDSVHAAYALDGVVSLSPPPAWTVDEPGPLRVSFSHSDGKRFVAARLADTADVLVAQDLAFAELQRVVPGATIDGFEPSVAGDDETVASFESLIAATAPDGRVIEGIVRVWADAVRSQVFSGISFNFVETPPSLSEENFLLNALDISLVEDR